MHSTLEISFCINNLARGTEKVKQSLISDPDVRVAEYACQRKCRICKDFYYALVDGKMFKATTGEKLLAEVHHYMDNEWL